MPAPDSLASASLCNSSAPRIFRPVYWASRHRQILLRLASHRRCRHLVGDDHRTLEQSSSRVAVPDCNSTPSAAIHRISACRKQRDGQVMRIGIPDGLFQNMRVRAARAQELCIRKFFSISWRYRYSPAMAHFAFATAGQHRKYLALSGCMRICSRMSVRSGFSGRISASG